MSEFNDKWSFYYHQPEDNDYTTKSYKLLSIIKTENDFWNTYTLMSQSRPFFQNGMYFFMKGDIFPRWEDEPVCKGSFYSFPVEFKSAYDIWELMSELLVTEKLTCNEIIMNQIAGISLSPKRSNMILKIWCLDKYDMPSEFPFNKEYFSFETYHTTFQRVQSRYAK